MTSNSSKSIPFLVLGIVALMMLAEVYYGVDIDLETLLPFFIALGITGGAKSAIEKASQARKAIPEEIKLLIRTELERVIPKRASAD